jgi:Alpha/beta hydrolase family
MKWTVLLVVLVLHVSVARAEADHIDTDTAYTSPQGSSSAQAEAATDATDAAEASARLLEVLTPILGGSLNAELYEPGCDAAIYMCSAASSSIQTMRFRTPAEVYADHAEAVKSEPVFVQNTAETSEEEAAAAVNDLLHDGHTVLEEVQQSGSCRARPSSDKRIAILLHGFLACSQKWHDIAQLLATEGFEVVLPLLPGHGAVDGDHVPSALHHVPADHPHIPILDRSVGYGTVAQAVADMTVAAIQQLDYAEVVLGGFSAGGAVVIDALTILATDGRLDAAALKRVRIVHVATFLETPNRVIRLARDLNPLLWINKVSTVVFCIHYVQLPCHATVRKALDYTSYSCSMSIR